MINDQEEWELDDILDSRLYNRGRRLQYRVKWKGYNTNLDWYNADGGEFKNSQDLVKDFYQRHPRKPHSRA